jgi:hypothetical protein
VQYCSTGLHWAALCSFACAIKATHFTSPLKSSRVESSRVELTQRSPMPPSSAQQAPPQDHRGLTLLCSALRRGMVRALCARYTDSMPVSGPCRVVRCGGVTGLYRVRDGRCVAVNPASPHIASHDVTSNPIVSIPIQVRNLIRFLVQAENLFYHSFLSRSVPFLTQ